MESHIDAYLLQRQAEGIRASSIHQYKGDLLIMVSQLMAYGCDQWNEVTIDDVYRLMESLHQKGWQKSTRQHFAHTMRSFFAWLLAHDEVKVNVAYRVPIPKDRNTPLPKPPLDETDIETIFTSLPRRNVRDLRNIAQLELLYGCGLRISECVNLNLRDVDLARRTVEVVDGKGGKDRLLPLMKSAVGALRDYLSLRRTLLRGPDTGALFLSDRGRRVCHDTFRTWTRGLSRVIGKRVHPHLFRHSIAVHLLRGGADIRAIQHFLGHSNLDTTKIYLRMVPGHLRDEYDAAMVEVVVGEL